MTNYQPPDWERAAAEFGLSAVLWHAMADSAYNTARPELGHFAEDFGGEVGHLYRKLAHVAESFQDRARELAYAEAHPLTAEDVA